MRYQYIEFLTPDHNKLLDNDNSSMIQIPETHPSKITIAIWIILLLFIIIIIYDCIT